MCFWLFEKNVVILHSNSPLKNSVLEKAFGEFFTIYIINILEITKPTSFGSVRVEN